MISQILQRIQLPWLFQQANPGQNVVAVPQQHFAANPTPANPPRTVRSQEAQIITLPRAMRTRLQEAITQGQSNPNEFLDRLNIIAEEVLNPSPALTRQVDNMLNEIQEDMPNLYNALQNLRRSAMESRSTASVRTFFQQFSNQSPQRAQVNLMNQFAQNQNQALYGALRRVIGSFSPENPTESEMILSMVSTISEAAIAPADSQKRQRLEQEFDMLLNQLEQSVEDSPENPLPGTPEEKQRIQQRVREQIAALGQLRTFAMSTEARDSQAVRNFFQQFRNNSPQLRQSDLLERFSQNQNGELSEILSSLTTLLNIDNCIPRHTNEVTAGVARIAQMFLTTNATERTNLYNQAREYFQGYEGHPGGQLSAFLDYANNNPNSRALRQFFQNFINENPQARQLQFLRRYQS